MTGFASVAGFTTWRKLMKFGAYRLLRTKRFILDSADFRRALNSCRELPARVARNELEKIAAETLATAQRYCPRETGTLAESGKVIQTSEGAEVAFDAPYSIFVHERLDVQHQNGGPKFLERATLEIAPTVAPRMAAELEAKIGELA